MVSSMIEVFFYIFAGLAVASALMVITQNNPVRCVLFLVLTFFATSVLWLLQGAEFLSLVLILVYVGAVMTLFLFVVMMLNVDIEVRKNQLWRYIPFGLIIVALLVGLLLVAIPKGFVQSNAQINQVVVTIAGNDAATLSENDSQHQPALSNTEAIGAVLYTEYVYAFEIAAVILLVAIVAAVGLAQRQIRTTKRQDIKQQLMVQAKDRVQLVSMKASKTQRSVKKS